MKFTFNPFVAWFRDPTAEQVREKQLADAEMQLAHPEAMVEYHEAMRNMLKRRIARLKKEKA